MVFAEHMVLSVRLLDLNGLATGSSAGISSLY